MKALTVRQPHAWSIMRGAKSIENRSRPTAHRGRIAIHAALSRVDLGGELPDGTTPDVARLVFGAVLGTVDLVDCIPLAEARRRRVPCPACAGMGHALGKSLAADSIDFKVVRCWRCKGRLTVTDPWAAGPWCWILTDPRPLAVPLPWKGALGLWELSDAKLGHVPVSARSRLFTSCFRNLATIKATPGLVPVAISVGVPSWFKGPREVRLAPTWAMLKMGAEDYQRHFEAILAKLDPAEVAASLPDGAVLLCWEAPGVRCHRRRVAEWIEEALGIKVPELGHARKGFPAYRDLPLKG